MAAALDMSIFNFCGETIRSVSELMIDEIIKAPDFNAFQTVFSNIVSVKDIGFVGKGTMVGVPNKGCNIEPQPWNVKTRTKQWNPKEWEVLIHLCWQDLNDTAAVYSLRLGKDIPDFTETDYAAILTNVLYESVREFFYRLYWFSDIQLEKSDGAGGGGTNAKLTNDPEVIVEGFHIIESGLWKQIRAIAAANPAKQLVTITENQGATYQQQEIQPDNVITYLRDMYRKSNLVLRRQSDLELVVTQNVWDAYAEWLEGRDIESTYRNMIDGIDTLYYRGIPLRPAPIFDEIIETYFDDGVKYDAPSRMLLTSKANIAVGVDKINAFDDLNIWYDRDTRLVKFEGMGRADALILRDDILVLGI